MKIYFDGCNHTSAEYLDARYKIDDWKEKRWSKILANKLGGEEYNFASAGSSNQRILRNITVNHNICDYDLAVIQMSFADRTEFFHNDNYIHVSPKKVFKFFMDGYGDEEILSFWKLYYENIHSKQYEEAYEVMIKKSIKAICKSNNVPLVLMSNCWRKEGSYDLIISHKKYGRMTPQDRHPRLESQTIIADDIYNFINITSVL